MEDIREKLRHLLSFGWETEVLEFKEAKTKFEQDELGRYFSALSNEANLSGKNEAWLVFGVRNDKSIAGTQYKTHPSSLYGLKEKIAQNTTNRITFKEIYEINELRKRVILFQIPAAPKGFPIAWKGHYYGRDGESLTALNLEELERIRKQAVLEDWSAVICEEASIEDLSKEAIEKARAYYGSKNPHLSAEIKKWNDITFLNKAKLCIRNKVTRAAILLLGKPESEHFINPATACITWILKDKDNLEKDYAHFSCPLILSVQGVYDKIRNLKYRYMVEGSFFPEEVDQYDPYIIREALNNCIAHQDYTLGGRINVVEIEAGTLTFVNSGSFIPKTIENVIMSDSPESYYRNKFLADAMVNLSMIDIIGSGIKRMFIIQKKKFFPLPEYDFSNEKVKLTITGKVLDMNYAKKLAQVPDMTLYDIMLLDKVQKDKPLSDSAVKELRRKKLIEGRKPNFYISSLVAKKIGQKSEYIKMRGLGDNHYKKMVLEYLEKYETASRKDINELLLDILPEVLNKEQKKNKVSNIINKMSNTDKTIKNKGTNRNPRWRKVTEPKV